MRRFLLLLFLMLFSGSLFCEDKIVMVIANRGFRDEELFKPLESFKKEGFSVVIASNSLSEARGMLGGRIYPDILTEEIEVEDYVAIVLVGGIGAKVFWDSSRLLDQIRKANSQDKIIGAICLAPVTLAKAGILEERRATVWPSEANTLKKYKAKYEKTGVIVDGNIVTASSPEYASKFGEEILKLIKSRKKKKEEGE